MCVYVSFHAGPTGEHLLFWGYVFAFSPPCGRSLWTLLSDLQAKSYSALFLRVAGFSSVAQLTRWQWKWQDLLFLSYVYETLNDINVDRLAWACKQASRKR